MDRAIPNMHLISSERVQDTDVYGTDDDKIGQIDHLMIDKPSGKVAYAVMRFGGFLGLGDGHFPIPWGMLHYDVERQAYVTGITESQLRDAPALSDDAWNNREWELQTHKYYGVDPYWGQ